MGPSYAIAMLLFARIRRGTAGELFFSKFIYMQMTCCNSFNGAQDGDVFVDG